MELDLCHSLKTAGKKLHAGTLHCFIEFKLLGVWVGGIILLRHHSGFSVHPRNPSQQAVLAKLMENDDVIFFRDEHPLVTLNLMVVCCVVLAHLQTIIRGCDFRLEYMHPPAQLPLYRLVCL